MGDGADLSAIIEAFALGFRRLLALWTSWSTSSLSSSYARRTDHIMMNYYEITGPDSEKLQADFNKCFGKRESIPCNVEPRHDGGHRRIGPLHLEVKHNRRDEQMIWSWGMEFAVHERILDGFEKAGFTGYRTNPATVRFGDGHIANDYHEFVVTGWAGIVSPDSGVRLMKTCPGCHLTEYSAITNYEQVIDWNQWTGEDFFLIWPMMGYRLITDRVAEWLQVHKVKSFRLERGLDARKRDSIISKLSISVGRLSLYLPEDLAIKYGRPLGLE